MGSKRKLASDIDMEEARRRVAAATIRLSGTGARGVLVPGGFILTAAHCIKWSGEGGMALGDYYLEREEPQEGQPFRVRPWAVEPLGDVAVLAALIRLPWAGLSLLAETG